MFAVTHHGTPKLLIYPWSPQRSAALYDSYLHAIIEVHRLGAVGDMASLWVRAGAVAVCTEDDARDQFGTASWEATIGSVSRFLATSHADCDERLTAWSSALGQIFLTAWPVLLSQNAQSAPQRLRMGTRGAVPVSPLLRHVAADPPCGPL